MSDHIEHACTNCGSLLHHEDVCPRELSTATRGSEPPAGAAKRPKLTMQEARELSADIARRAEERRKAAVALECTPPPQQPGGTPEDTPETDAKWNAIVDDENTSQTIGGTKWKAVAIRLCEEMRTLERQRNEARAALAAAQAEVAEADRRAGKAERRLAYERDSTSRREDWLRKAKEQWGVHHTVSFDVVWNECLTLKERLTAAEQRAEGAEKEQKVQSNLRAYWAGEYQTLCMVNQERHQEILALTAQRDTALRERDGADSLAKLQREAREWADATFPHSDDRARLKHIEKEVQELLQEPADGEEMADILLILSHHAHRHGVDLLSAARAKFEKCKLRKWGKPDEDGVCQHISEGDAALAAKTPEGGV